MPWEYSDIELGKRPRCPICDSAEDVAPPTQPGGKFTCGRCGTLYRARWVADQKAAGITGGRVVSEQRITVGRVQS